MLVVNVNELEIVKACEKCGIPYKVESFTPGDLKNVAETFVIERKGFHDFWSSMCDKRIYEQTKKMYETYSGNRYVFVEVGSLVDLALEYKKNVNWIYSLFGEIENWNVKFREYNDMEDLVRKAYSLDLKLGSERKIRDRIVKLYGLTVAEKALIQFPSLGKDKAKALLKESTNLLTVINNLYNKPEELAKVHGIKVDGVILTSLREELERHHE